MENCLFLFIYIFKYLYTMNIYYTMKFLIYININYKGNEHKKVLTIKNINKI